jgi:hypothetical protein
VDGGAAGKRPQPPGDGPAWGAGRAREACGRAGLAGAHRADPATPPGHLFAPRLSPCRPGGPLLCLRQVRKPLYASAVGRWRPYKRQLAPLRARLAKWVEAYERRLAETEARRAREAAPAPAQAAGAPAMAAAAEAGAAARGVARDEGSPAGRDEL